MVGVENLLKPPDQSTFFSVLCTRFYIYMQEKNKITATYYCISCSCTATCHCIIGDNLIENNN